MGHGRLRHVKVSVKICLKRAVEMFLGKIVERRYMLLKCRVVDEDIERT
jgi:hypothetical protein